MESNIIWINGAFGGGKTQTAVELHRRLPGSFFYDPENIGAWLRKNEPAALREPDYQNEPLWREFNYKMLAHIAAKFDGVVFAPMTLTNPVYYDEIIGRLRRGGVGVTHVQLTASEKTLLRRQRSRFDGSKSWAARQLPRCMAAFGDPCFENKIETDGLSIPEVAEQVAALCGLELLPRKRGLRQKFDEIFTSLSVIRR